MIRHMASQSSHIIYIYIRSIAIFYMEPFFMRRVTLRHNTLLNISNCGTIHDEVLFAFDFKVQSMQINAISIKKNFSFLKI